MSSYSSTDTNAPCRPATAAVRAGIDRDAAYGAVTPPIVLSSNFSFAGFAQKREYDYTRSGNPTRDLLADEVWKINRRVTPLDKVINVHISHLREKIERHGTPRLIRTVRGVGFMLAGDAP